MARITEGTNSTGSTGSSPNAVQKPGRADSYDETALVEDRTQERYRKELLETLHRLKVDHRNSDLWMEAASHYMGLGNPEMALQCTKASIGVEVKRKEDDEVATRLVDHLRRELPTQETVPCPNCDTLLELGSMSCHVCGLELQG